MITERPQEAPVTLRGNRSDRSEDALPGENDEEPGTDDRCRKEPAGRKVGIGWRDHLVEAWNAKVKPSADAADEKVTMEGHLPQDEGGPFLPLVICLRDFCDDDVTLPHIRDSAP